MTRKREAGQAIVEFVLIVPLLLMILIGIFQFGRLFAEYLLLDFMMEHVAQASARLGGYSSDLDIVLDNHLYPLLDKDRIAYQVNTMDEDGNTVCGTGDCTCDYGEYTVVETQYPTSVQVLFFRSSLVLKTKSTLHCWRGGAP